MKIELISIAQPSLVHFRCAAGEAAATWRGATIAPIVGRSYDAELDVEVPLKIGENATLDATASRGLQLRGADVELSGAVEGVDTDGLVYLRLADDCIVMIESQGALFQTGDLIRLLISPRQMALSPTGV
jgi:hypothetical protein